MKKKLPGRLPLSNATIAEILSSNLRDPLKVFGMHHEEQGMSIRTFAPEAAGITVYARDAATPLCDMEKIHPDGIFRAFFPEQSTVFEYDLVIIGGDGTRRRIIDPYSFGPCISEQSLNLFGQGNNQRIYDDLGAHLRVIGGVGGVLFAVWAPNAKRVSVVGGFNKWDGRRHPMQLLGSSGVWELFIPGLGEGEVYKYEIKKWDRDHLALKTDPYGFYQEPFPHHGSIVFDLDAFEWDDSEWMEKRKSENQLHAPMSIYEVHLGSWLRMGPEEDAKFVNYELLAVKLAEYVKHLGFTHVELMPIQEHPYIPSWGYQVTGFFAPNHRFGTPRSFQHFVEYLHSQGIGVIIDWVAGHFPKDDHGLPYFDGTYLYEHQDPREGVHQDWGTLIFNCGRHEVRNFLTANALFWLDKFHIDGLRIDAVASMLYRNYSRKDGEWIPNKYGGVENLESVEFLKSVNSLAHSLYPGVVTIAEESTAWPKVTHPTQDGGLGFSFKWNMGWMHDTLYYFTRDPVYRKYHQNQLTFSLWYAFHENFVLVLSHDEVVHGKRSLLEKMPGDTWYKYANLRALLAYMIGHPGKKLLFMGGEFGMHNEWCCMRQIDWDVTKNEDDAYHHNGLALLVKDLNELYRREPALWERDFEPRGFTWIDFSDADSNVISFMRHGNEPHYLLIFACNFSPVVRYGYRVGVPHGGNYREVLNTDAQIYGGAGYGNLGGQHSSEISWNNRPHSLLLTLPPLSVVVFRWKQ